MRRFRRSSLAPILGAVLLALPAAAAQAQTLEQAVLDEINHVRANPRAYALELAEGPAPGEEPGALEDAVADLMRQRPLPPLADDARISAAALAHAAPQGRSGQLGHGAAGSLGERLRRQGVWAGLSAENISYGHRHPRDVVRQLVVDSGVPGAGHRRNILNPSYTAAGVACGDHRVHGAMCVIDFAGALPEGGSAPAR